MFIIGIFALIASVLLQEDGYMTKFLNYNLRSIYAFHLPPPPPSIEEEVPQVTSPPALDKVSSKGTTVVL